MPKPQAPVFSMSKYFSEEKLNELAAKNLVSKQELEEYDAKPWTQLFDCLVVSKDTSLVVAVSVSTEECLDESFID